MIDLAMEGKKTSKEESDYNEHLQIFPGCL